MVPVWGRQCANREFEGQNAALSFAVYQLFILCVLEIADEDEVLLPSKMMAKIILNPMEAGSAPCAV